MKVKLKNISPKNFMLIFSVLNVIVGFLLGAIVSIASLLNPQDQGSAVGVWSVLFFPFFNGLIGLAASVSLAGLYNLLTKFFGGIELEFEPIEQ